jgi:hypothetical protein
MKIDSVVTDIITNVAKHNAVQSVAVLDMVNAYYKGVKGLIEKDESNVIKMDFFGKVIHNESWKQKTRLHRQLKQDRETTEANEAIRD